MVVDKWAKHENVGRVKFKVSSSQQLKNNLPILPLLLLDNFTATAVLLLPTTFTISNSNDINNDDNKKNKKYK